MNAAVDRGGLARPADADAAVHAPRLGFLGLGWIGRMRLDAVADAAGIEVAAVADVDAGAVESAARRFPRAQAVASFEQLLECDLDGVVIATPSGQHAEQAVAALERGHAVFCQKPVAVTAADAARVVQAAANADRLLAVDYCYRHVQGMQELRRRVLDGELGRIVAVDLMFHNAYAPGKSWCRDRALAGGGCLLDLGVHLLDLALWLQDFPTAELVRSQLFREGVRYRVEDGGTEDFAMAQFRQSDGAAIRLACSWHAHTGRDAVIELALHGTRGGAAWRNVNGSFYDFEVTIHRGAGHEALGSYPDAWGPRALAAWAAQLAEGKGFDPIAWGVVRGATLIDAIYGCEEPRQ